MLILAFRVCFSLVRGVLYCVCRFEVWFCCYVWVRFGGLPFLDLNCLVVLWFASFGQVLVLGLYKVEFLMILGFRSNCFGRRWFG